MNSSTPYIRGSQTFFHVDYFRNFTGFGEPPAAIFLPYSRHSSLTIWQLLIQTNQ